MTTQSVDPLLKKHLDKQLLKYAAGSIMCCPSCGRSMDAKKTVVFTIYCTNADGRETIAKQFVQCSGCWSKLEKIGLEGVRLLMTKHPELKARWEIVDGRTVFSSRKQKDQS